MAPSDGKKRGFDTQAVHFGEQFGEKGSLNVPIYQNSTYKQKVPGEWEEYTYTRTKNPTEDALRRSLASLEGGNYGVIFSSGLAAVAALMELFVPGDHIVSTADIYGGTHRLFTQLIARRGIEFSFVETSDPDAITEAVKPATKLVYIETPSNPLLKITDLTRLGALTKERKILLAVDNTMATPYFQRPLALGADIVLHSLSKYVSGHTNVIAGALIVNDKDLFDRLHFLRKATGGVPGPFDCYLCMLGIKTLALRMRQHEANAFKIAKHLREHSRVSQVYYPGLPEHPHHSLAKSQMSGFGGIVSFELNEDEAACRRFIQQLELFPIAISFGSVTSLSSHPASMSHKDMPKDERRRRGFSDSLIRLSVGIESVEDLTADLDNALSKI